FSFVEPFYCTSNCRHNRILFDQSNLIDINVGVAGSVTTYL
ncbi:MAG: hypothetical protein ACI86X_000700, partial [Moritella sp.]